VKLSEDLEYWRAERPSEWLMDEFIRGAKDLELKNADMLAMLEELEWINEVVEEGVTLCLCPECDTGNVHMPECKLGNLLKKVKGG
jgi:hypothetical protein